MKKFSVKKNISSLGIFFIALSFLIFEISLIRILSVLLTPSVSFLAVSTALFGIALGGMVVYLFQKFFSLENLNKRIKNFSILYVASLIGFIIAIMNIVIPRGNVTIGNTILIFIISSTPFIFANVILALLFKFQSSKINQLYFFDLIGAGIGVIISVILLGIIGPTSILLISVILALVATVLLNLQYKKIIIISLILMAIIAAFIPINEKHELIRIKSLFNKFNLESTNILMSEWNSFSHISVDSGPQYILQSFPISLNIQTPNTWGIRIDGSAYTVIYNLNNNLDEIKFLENDLSNLGFKLAEPGQVLIIGPGGGRDVLMALLNGHKVTGIEINPIIVNDVMRGIAKDFSGNIYNRDDVNIIIAEGRSFINQSSDNYNIISIPLVDTWASSVSGSLALVESNLYTVEAMEDYLNHLTDDGVLTISRWDFDGMRLISLFLEASKKLKIESPENNIAIVRTNGLDNYLFKKVPISDKQEKIIENFSNQKGLDLMYLPGKTIDNNFNSYLKALDRDAFVKNFSKDISPVYDDKPFFFFTPKLNLFSPSDYYTIDGGLFSAFFVTLFLTFLLILFPILFKIVQSVKEVSLKISSIYIGYFAAIGLGFILIELALIQKFILYLAQPIYSYSVILATMLIFAGLGSFFGKRLPQKKLTFAKLSLSIFTLTIITAFGATYIIGQTISLDISIKIIIASLIIAPVSFLMGMMMPLGIRRLNDLNLNIVIPWGWSVNGATSVLGSVLAIILAISFGFTTVLIIGATIYLIALIFIYLT